METLFENLVKSLSIDNDDKKEYLNYFARKYKPILQKLKKRPKEKDDLLILATVLSSLEGLKNEENTKNAKKDNPSNLLLIIRNYFRNQISEHSDYKLIFNDSNSNIKTERTPCSIRSGITVRRPQNRAV